jgi:hypothetical protein
MQNNPNQAHTWHQSFSLLSLSFVNGCHRLLDVPNERSVAKPSPQAQARACWRAIFFQGSQLHRPRARNQIHQSSFTQRSTHLPLGLGTNPALESGSLPSQGHRFRPGTESSPQRRVKHPPPGEVTEAS